MRSVTTALLSALLLAVVGCGGVDTTSAKPDPVKEKAYSDDTQKKMQENMEKYKSQPPPGQ